MRQSQVNLDFEFSEEIYTVSILNINTGGGLQTLMGHSTLVVEGLKSSVGASIATRELFVGQYDLLGDNENNVVTQIRVFEQNDYQSARATAHPLLPAPRGERRPSFFVRISFTFLKKYKKKKTEREIIFFKAGRRAPAKKSSARPKTEAALLGGGV